MPDAAAGADLAVGLVGLRGGDRDHADADRDGKAAGRQGVPVPSHPL